MQLRAVLLACLLLLVSSLATAAALPAGFTETPLTKGVVRPTAMALSPDGRIFVCEQTGKLRVIKDGKLLSEAFLTVPVFTEGERGLVGVALDPDFPTTPHVYVYYTAPKPTVHNRVSRFTAQGDVAGKGSETVILDLPDLAKPIHNGGAMHFGPDGKLYIAVGENAVPENAQSLANPLGKILRFNKDGSIPTDNPFYGRTNGMSRSIWAMGLRNPFTFAFQPGTGRMFINDVGRNAWEEINDGKPGANYGWPVVEGPGTPNDNPAYTKPVYAYRHGPTAQTGCAITGGAFYNPEEMLFPAEFEGTYFFADFCSGWIRRLDPETAQASAFATGIDGPVGLAVGADGSLYYLAHVEGAVYKVSHTGDPKPRITDPPADARVSVGYPASFRVGASGAQPLRYQWRRDGVDIPGATGPVHDIPETELADDGAVFDVVVSNAHGSATSGGATLTVLTDLPPEPRITAPEAGLIYEGRQRITYAGEATDPEDGPLPATALTWRVDFHHNTHFHPFLPSASGAAGGTFTVPNRGETSANVWYRIHLTVTDSAGLTSSTFVDILPRKVLLTFVTDPPGLQILLDGEPRTTPFTEEAVAGLIRTLSAVPQQTWTPIGWSDHGNVTHEISTPATDTTYTAIFNPIGTQHGLMATYFDDQNLSQPVLTRVDPVVDFDWGFAAPAEGMGQDTFSVRWTGKIEARVNGQHTFLVKADNGARLWVDGKLLVNTGKGANQSKGTINLKAGKSYSIRMEYYDRQDVAMVRLLWQAKGLRREVVPQSQLTP